MIVQIRVFIQPTLSPCAREAAKSMYEEAKKNIENEQKDVEIKTMYWPINSAEARTLGVYQVGTLFIEEKQVLEGYYSRYHIESELRKYINAKRNV